MIVTIDGPSGAGKSSTARRLAQRLGFDFLDTGATFRAVALAVARHNVDPENEDALADLMPQLHISLPGERVLLNGEDVTERIRTADVTAASSAIAARPVVRRHLAVLQREIADGKNVVCEGRDQGTVVFPDAECKFFLTADPMERARRRQLQLADRGDHVELEVILTQQHERDRRDSERDLAPLKPAEDSIQIDSTSLSLEQVVDQMEEIVRQCSVGASRP